MSGVLGAVNDFLGLKNNFRANVQGPDASQFQSPNQQYNQNRLSTYLANAGQAQAPTATAATIDPSQQAQFRSQQNTLASQLAQTAAGQGVSPAQLQLQQGMQQQLAQQRAAAASVGGDVNPMLLQRQLADSAANAGQAMNAQAAIQRAGETMQARQALGGLLAQGREQDIGMAGQQAGMQQQAALANQQAGMQQQGLNAQNQQWGLGQSMSLDQQQLQANIQQQQMAQQAALANAQINSGVAQSNTAANAQLFGGLLSAGSALGAAAITGPVAPVKKVADNIIGSDENIKKEIDRGVDKDMDDFLSQLDPASYEYKDPALGKGRHWSVMAQSAARSKAGRSFVVQTPDGLALDTRRGFGVALTALKHLADRQTVLERRLITKKAKAR